MAFVRWRGGCSQLIATIYEDGRSRQITLANLPDFYVSESTKHHVAQKFPKISVDWAAVDRKLARGPSGLLKESTPLKHLDYAVVEHHLRQWANEAEMAKRGNDATSLRLAADALTRWRAEFYWSNQLGFINTPQV
ncbi:MAG: hypothetical protein GX138_06280 [Firmicutes bacterium]|nr:hypothetical protein [Bacillota bacterium]